MKKINLIVMALAGINFMIIQNSNAQDVHFSQYRETPLLVNPGQTALNNDIRIILNYKDQWRSFVSPYKTLAFSFEIKASKKKNKENYIGLGVNVFSDKAGDSKMGTTLGALNVSGVLKVSEDSKLGVGIMVGAGQKTVDYSNLQWESQYVSSAYVASAPNGETQGSSSFSYLDAGAGIAWSYGKEQQYISANNGVRANIGIAAFHFGLPAYSFYGQSSEKLNTKFVAHGNFEFGKKNTNVLIDPQFLYTKQGALQELVVGTKIKYIMQEASKYTLIKKSSVISLGIDYRLADAMIFSLMYEYSNYAIGISYDVNASRLTALSKTRGGLEVSLRFVTPNPFSRSKPSF